MKNDLEAIKYNITQTNKLLDIIRPMVAKAA